MGPLSPWAENGVVGASYEVKMIRERPYVQSGTVFMNRHLIKGFDTPFRSQLPDSAEGWTNKGAENHFLEFMVHMSVLCVAARCWNMVGFVCVQASFPKKSSDSHCCVELPFLVFLLSASKINAQRKWSFFFSKLFVFKGKGRD